MIRAIRLAAPWIAVAALISVPGPASADSFFFGFQVDGRHRPAYHSYSRPTHRPYYPHFRPPPIQYSYRPPVVIVRQPPPRVVYLPAPTVVVPPLVAVPASPTFRTTDGRTCREYQTTIIVNGWQQPGYGTACLQPDGAWRVVN